MKIAFPHMGYLHIPLANMLNNLGIGYIPAPPISKKTVELGSLHSPEGACLPYKIIMGNLLESVDQGADAILTLCGAGKCRMGLYNAVQKINLASKKPLTFYAINTEHLFKDLYQFLCSTGKVRPWIVLKNIALAVQTLKALDAINAAKNYYGAQATAPDLIIKLFDQGMQRFFGCRTFNEVNHIKDTVMAQIQMHAQPAKIPPPKIALLGEFYVLMEPYVNHTLENLLVKQGIQVKKFVHTGEWAYAKTLLQTLGLYNEEKDFLSKAQPYLNHHVGGDGLKSVGSALFCAQNGYDGIIHIYPFGCMPEVVAQYALKNISTDYQLPLLTLSLDEHSSDVGIITRVEAFVDCLKRKQQVLESPAGTEL